MIKLDSIRSEKIWGYEDWIASTHPNGMQKEFYEFLGLDKIRGCDLIGWESDSMDEFYNRSWDDIIFKIINTGDIDCFTVQYYFKDF